MCRPDPTRDDQRSGPLRQFLLKAVGVAVEMTPVTTPKASHGALLYPPSLSPVLAYLPFQVGFSGDTDIAQYIFSSQEAVTGGRSPSHWHRLQAAERSAPRSPRPRCAEGAKVLSPRGGTFVG